MCIAIKWQSAGPERNNECECVDAEAEEFWEGACHCVLCGAGWAKDPEKIFRGYWGDDSGSKGCPARSWRLRVLRDIYLVPACCFESVAKKKGYDTQRRSSRSRV
jgi:hypothetical protein